jgi:pyruvate,water dikinase
MGSRGKAGAEWLAAFEAAREPWFQMSTGDGFYHHHRAWKHDLTIPFVALGRYVDQLRQGNGIDRDTAKLAEERKRIIGEYRGLLQSDEERGAFDQMLGLCHKVFPYIEDHKFYCEHWYTSLFFEKIREFGALLARNGFFADGEDVFHLNRQEVETALADLMQSWSTGGAPKGPKHWPPIVAERKRMLDLAARWSPPPALGPVPATIEDPALIMLWGITTETLKKWQDQQAGGSSAKEISGFAASPGIVEGTARVVKSVEEIHRLQEGDILVCPVTNPSWAPIFGKIKAAVSDIGGSMSHAAIVAREYGLPAVVGTGSSTQRIRDGQRVRVDGTHGIVTLLD